MPKADSLSDVREPNGPTAGLTKNTSTEMRGNMKIKSKLVMEVSTDVEATTELESESETSARLSHGQSKHLIFF